MQYIMLKMSQHFAELLGGHCNEYISKHDDAICIKSYFMSMDNCLPVLSLNVVGQSFNRLVLKDRGTVSLKL